MTGLGTWLRQHPLRVLGTALVSAAVGYVVNVWLMAVKYEGYQVPSGAVVTGKGNLLAGGMFWLVLSSLLTAVITYRVAVGADRFWADVRSLPAQLALLVRAGGAGARVQLLSGAAVGLLLTLVLTPTTGGLVGVGLLAAAPTVIGSVLSQWVSTAWSKVLRRVAPGRAGVSSGPATMAVVVVGAGLGLALSFLVSSTTLRVVLLIVAAVLALVLASRGGPAGAVGVLLLVLAVSTLLGDRPAFADDGGYAECGSNWNKWLHDCAGTTEVLTNSLGGALAAALGSPFGAFLGQAAAARPLGELPPAGQINDRLAQLNQEVTDPAIYERMQELFAKLRASGGQFGGAELSELEALEGQQEMFRQARLGQIGQAQEAARQDHRSFIRDREAAAQRTAAQRAEDEAALAAIGDKLERLAELRETIARAEREGDRYKRQAAIAGFLENAAAVTGLVADRSIDVLARLTGPAGEALKTGYVLAKGVGSTVGTGYATGSVQQAVVAGVGAAIDYKWTTTWSKNPPLEGPLGTPVKPGSSLPSPYGGLPISTALRQLNPWGGSSGSLTRAALTASGQSYAQNVGIRDPVKNLVDAAVGTAIGAPGKAPYPWQGRDPLSRATNPLPERK